MKKFLLLAVAVVFTAMFVSPSFAVEASFDGQYRVRAFTIENAQDFADDNSRVTSGNANQDQDAWIDQRFRLGITMKEAPVTGYVQLQIGGSGPNGSRVWGTTADEGAGLMVSARQAYLSFPVGPLGLTVGRTYASHKFLAGGMFENIADRYVVTYKASSDLAISFIHAKATEGTTDTYRTTTSGSASGVNDNDKNVYNIGFTYKPEGAPYDVSARAYYVRDGANYISQTGASTAGGDWEAYWLTAETNLKFDPVKIYLSAAYVDGESNPANTGTSFDIQGYALHGDISATFGPVKLGLVAGMGSGDDNTTDTDLETFFAPGGASYVHSHIFWQAGENTYSNNYMDSTSIRTNLNTQNGSRETLSNVTWAGIYGDYKATDDLTLSAKLATFEKTESLDNTEDHIGEEIDLSLNYKIHKGLTLFAFAAWFMPDDGIICNTTNVSTTACINGTVANHNDDEVTAYYARLQWDF